jgi:hypothetical protein
MTHLHDSAVSLGRGSPLGKDFGLLELEGVLALGELGHDVGNLLLQTEVVLRVTEGQRRVGKR